MNTRLLFVRLLAIGGVALLGACKDDVGLDPDATPDPFSFAAQNNVPLSSVRTSAPVQITGIGAAQVTIQGGTFSIANPPAPPAPLACGSTFASAATVITNGQVICVRHTSAATANASVRTLLTVGTANAAFVSTTADGAPDPFAFTDRSNVGQSLPQVSNTVTITGISAPAPIAVTGGEYSIGCSGTFTSANGTISNNQTVCVRHTSSSSPATAVNTALTVGGVSDTFTTTTAAAAPNYSGNVFGVTAGTAPRLLQFAANAPNVIANGANGVAISGLTGTPSVLGMDFQPKSSLLFALTSDAALYTINTTTGAATSVCTLAADTADTTSPYTGLTGAAFGVDFNPTGTGDFLRVVSNTGQNLRVNVTNCLTTTDTAINPGTPALVGAGYTDSVSGAAPAATTLFVVDTSNDSLATQNPPNDGTLTAVGALATAVNNLAGFDVVRVGATDHLGLLSVDGPVNSTLFRVNLLSGQAFSAGVIGGGAVVTDIAIPIP